MKIQPRNYSLNYPSINLFDLPPEILLKIFHYLNDDLNHLRELRIVCSRFKIIIEDPQKILKLFEKILTSIFYSNTSHQEKMKQLDIYALKFSNERSFLNNHFNQFYFESLKLKHFEIANFIYEKHRNFINFKHKLITFETLKIAAKLGHSLTIENCIMFFDKSNKFIFSKLFKIAAKNGHTNIVNLLLNKINCDKMFLWTMKKNLIEIAKILREHGVIVESIYNAIWITLFNETICLNKKIEIINWLYKDDLNISRIQWNYLLNRIIEKGKLELCDFFITKFRSFIDFDDAVYSASSNNQKDILHFLLSDKEINLSQNNYALIKACEKNYFEIVKILLDDKRIYPGLENNKALVIASRFNYINIVKDLLKDERVDPADYDNACMQWAMKNKEPKIIELLLKHPNYDPTYRNHDALRAAIFLYDDIDIIKLFFEDPRFDISIFIDEIIESQDLKIIEVLINCENLSLLDKDYVYIKWTEIHGSDLTNLLFKNDQKSWFNCNLI